MKHKIIGMDKPKKDSDSDEGKRRRSFEFIIEIKLMVGLTAFVAFTHPSLDLMSLCEGSPLCLSKPHLN
jgi:hypothetical protein